MNCPRESCNSPNTNVRKTQSGARLPKEYLGNNIVRRFYTCVECGQNFFTIELEEAAYNTLQSPPGRLETVRLRVRS